MVVLGCPEGLATAPVHHAALQDGQRARIARERDFQPIAGSPLAWSSDMPLITDLWWPPIISTLRCACIFDIDIDIAIDMLLYLPVSDGRINLHWWGQHLYFLHSHTHQKSIQTERWPTLSLCLGATAICETKEKTFDKPLSCQGWVLKGLPVSRWKYRTSKMTCEQLIAQTEKNKTCESNLVLPQRVRNIILVMYGMVRNPGPIVAIHRACC